MTEMENMAKRSTAAAAKSKYSTPVLVIFGDVKRLTQSTGSQNGDGGQNMKAK